MSFITFVGDRDSPRYCQPGVLQLTLPLLRVCLGHGFRVQSYFQLGMAKLIYFCHYFLSDFLFVCLFVLFGLSNYFFSLSPLLSFILFTHLLRTSFLFVSVLTFELQILECVFIKHLRDRYPGVKLCYSYASRDDDREQIWAWCCGWQPLLAPTLSWQKGGWGLGSGERPTGAYLLDCPPLYGG